MLIWQVNCRDRRGLLSDLITALKSFPLEITTAAVTTTADGYVYDVFQVRFISWRAVAGNALFPSAEQPSSIAQTIEQAVLQFPA